MADLELRASDYESAPTEKGAFYEWERELLAKRRAERDAEIADRERCVCEAKAHLLAWDDPPTIAGETADAWQQGYSQGWTDCYAAILKRLLSGLEKPPVT